MLITVIMLITVLMLIGLVPCSYQLCSEKSGVSDQILITVYREIFFLVFFCPFRPRC